MPTFRTEPRTPSLRTLLEEVYDGRIVVPRFRRRGLLWDATRRLELFDSIYRGFPIGSLLVWRTHESLLPTYDRVGLLPVATAPGSGGGVEYLLDGYQRLSVLYTALGPALFDPPPELDAAEDGTDFRWPVCFDLRADADSNPFIQAPQGERPKHIVPLDRLFDAYRLDEMKDELRAAQGTRREVNRLAELADRIRDTRVPINRVGMERVEEAILSFVRVNSGGVRMDEVDMVNALSWINGFDLDERLDVAFARLAEVGWGAFPRSDLLAVVKLRLGRPIYKTSAEELALELRAHPEVLDQATEAVLEVASHLATLAIFGPRSLPYTAQAVLLASGRVHLQPSDEVLRWILRTGFTERFAGATDTTFATELETLQSQLDADHVWPEVEVDPVTRFVFQTARCKVLAQILGAQAMATERVALEGADAFQALYPARRAAPLTLTAANRFAVPASELPSLRRRLVNYDPDLEDKHLVDERFTTLYARGKESEALRARLELIDDKEQEWANWVNIRVRARTD